MTVWYLVLLSICDSLLGEKEEGMDVRLMAMRLGAKLSAGIFWTMRVATTSIVGWLPARSDSAFKLV